MQTLILHDVDDGLVERLNERAAAHGRTPEAELRVVLSAALAANDDDHVQQRMDAFRASISNRPHTLAEILIREGRESR